MRLLGGPAETFHLHREIPLGQAPQKGPHQPGKLSGELADRFWKHLRSPELAAQERLFFEVYGQALQGRQWAKPLLDGIVENWVAPVAAMLEADGVSPETGCSK